MLALAVPAALLLIVKLASVVLDRMFIMRDMLISAAGIAAVVVAACLVPLFRRTAR